VAAGLVHPKVDRFSLGRGVKEQQVGNVHAWRFFPDALDLPDVELAPPLTLVAGGKP
jgi:hypothetical protein